MFGVIWMVQLVGVDWVVLVGIIQLDQVSGMGWVVGMVCAV